MTGARKPRHSDFAVVFGPVAALVIIAAIVLHVNEAEASPDSTFADSAILVWAFVGGPGLLLAAAAVIAEARHQSKRRRDWRA